MTTIYIFTGTLVVIGAVAAVCFIAAGILEWKEQRKRKK
jgi:hypothetical protein